MGSRSTQADEIEDLEASAARESEVVLTAKQGQFERALALSRNEEERRAVYKMRSKLEEVRRSEAAVHPSHMHVHPSHTLHTVHILHTIRMAGSYICFISIHMLHTHT